MPQRLNENVQFNVLKGKVTMQTSLLFSTLLITVTLTSCSGYDYSEESGMNAKQCKRVQTRCVGGVYDEWFQKNGDLACACNGKLNIPDGKI